MPVLHRLARAVGRRAHRAGAGIALLALAGAVACSDATGPDGGTLTGRWTSTDGQGGSVLGAPITLVLDEDRGAVSGTGSYELAGATVPLEVSGTVSDRVVMLTLTPPPAGGRTDELLLQAMLSDDGQRLTAELTGDTTSETRIFHRQ